VNISVMTSNNLTVVPYAMDSATLVLDHFDGSSVAAISGNRAVPGCGSPNPVVPPNYSFTQGLDGLGQALTLAAPQGEPSGSSTYLQYPGGQLLSIPSGTLELWVYLTSYASGLSL